MKRKNNERISLSIEGQLKSYTECIEKTERHDILWHAWKHNKHWLCQVQEWILPSFPSYSRHGESHALSVLNNIEMILGDNKIKKLSASDCFLILNVVYIHDIGMCITYKEKQKLTRNNKFIEYLEKCSETGDNSMRKYANILLESYKNTTKQNVKTLLKTELEVCHALTYILSEYRRKEHGEKSKKLLNEWILKPDKLGSGFSTIGIPSRLFYTIAGCAGIHSSVDFQDVMDLPMEDSGYARDFMHPRFAAVLLQLGDALDLDNDRFHPLIKDFMGNIPELSKTHMEKHQSIRRLRISPDKITIYANCNTPESLRLVAQECNAIKNILSHATFRWSVICPKGLEAHLPTFEKTKLLLCGKEIDEQIINAKFEIQQDKAFNLLKGKNFYQDPFDFLKEIFQNAVDASKIQYYKQWKEGAWRNIENFWEFAKKISPMSYPINIEMHTAKKEKYGKHPIPLSKEKDKIPNKKFEYGVLVKVKDYATGISSEDILAIANVGTSYERHRKLVESMPPWLSPTAEFGIGLQSVFLVTTSFYAISHTRKGESYKIEFEATGGMGSGYINVTPIEFDPKIDSYGTEFEIFVPIDYKLKHLDQPESWSGLDPYVPEYKKIREFRHSRELMLQMAIYLNDKIGEKLFPVELSLYDFEDDPRIHKKFQQLHFNINIQAYFGDIKNNISKNNDFKKNIRKVTWTYNIEEETSNRYKRWNSIDSENHYEYMFDTEDLKLYLWDQKNGLYARIGANRLFNNYKVFHDNELYKDKGTKIYYKGIFVKETFFTGDMCLLESIDIKSKLHRKYIAINRSDFTLEGEDYIKNNIYLTLKDNLNIVLSSLENKFIQGTTNNLKDTIYQNLAVLTTNEKMKELEEELHKKILACVTFALSSSTSKDNIKLFSKTETISQSNNWDNLLSDISTLIKKNKLKNSTWSHSTLYNINVYNETKFTNPLDIAEIAKSTNKYAIISYRSDYGREWSEYLYQIQLSDNKEDNQKNIWQNIMDLNKESHWEKRKELIKNTENWRDNIFNFFKNIVLEPKAPENNVLATHWILNWILKNIPSIAVFTSSDNRMRINILNAAYTSSVYFDANTLYLMCEKMFHTYDEYEVERFYTISMAGYQQLALEKKPLSAYFIKKGRFAYESCKQVIFPLSGKKLKNIFNKLKDSLNISSCIQNTAENFKKFRNSIIDLNLENCNTDFNKKQDSKNIIIQEKLNDFNNLLHKYYTEKEKQTSKITLLQDIQSNTIENYPEICLDIIKDNKNFEDMTREELQILDYFYKCIKIIQNEIGLDSQKIWEDNLTKELEKIYIGIEELSENNPDETKRKDSLSFIQYLKKDLLLKDISEKNINDLYECMIKEIDQGIKTYILKKRYDSINSFLEKYDIPLNTY